MISFFCELFRYLSGLLYGFLHFLFSSAFTAPTQIQPPALAVALVLLGITFIAMRSSKRAPSLMLPVWLLLFVGIFNFGLLGSPAFADSIRDDQIRSAIRGVFDPSDTPPASVTFSNATFNGNINATNLTISGTLTVGAFTTNLTATTTNWTVVGTVTSTTSSNVTDVSSNLVAIATLNAATISNKTAVITNALVNATLSAATISNSVDIATNATIGVLSNLSGGFYEGGSNITFALNYNLTLTNSAGTAVTLFYTNGTLVGHSP